jgi:hypothetical protein
LIRFHAARPQLAVLETLPHGAGRRRFKVQGYSKLEVIG